MWLIFTMVTVLAWSGSDLFSKMGVGKNDRYSHFKMAAAVGLVMGLHALYQITLGGIAFDFRSILTYLPVSAMYILSMLFGYAGLRYIELSVSTPICNSSGAVAALLCFLVLGQRMTGVQFAAVALICAGVIVLAVLERKRALTPKVERKYTHSFLAILFPILYCVIDGVASFTDAYYLENVLDEYSANIAYEFTFLFVGIIAAVYVFAVKREKFQPKYEGVKSLAAVFETVGQFTYVFALSSNAIVAAPTISSYAIFSVLWSRLFLKEKLSGKHYAVIAIVLAGILLLAVTETLAEFAG